MASVGTNDGSTFDLNLFPLLDIFSILICFLLMNYSTQGASVESKGDDMELPPSDTKLSLDTAPSVSITKSKLIIQGSLEKALEIPIGPDGDVPEEYNDQGAIREVYEIFKILAKNNETLRNRNQTLKLTKTEVSTLIMEADKMTQFKLVRRVMQTAQQAEFISWKLAVQKNSID